MSALTERLRERADRWGGETQLGADCTQAADTIDALAEALRAIADGKAFDMLRYSSDDPSEYHMRRERQAMNLARAALAKAGL